MQVKIEMLMLEGVSFLIPELIWIMKQFHNWWKWCTHFSISWAGWPYKQLSRVFNDWLNSEQSYITPPGLSEIRWQIGGQSHAESKRKLWEPF
jgi:hypothetical protein